MDKNFELNVTARLAALEYVTAFLLEKAAGDDEDKAEEFMRQLFDDAFDTSIKVVRNGEAIPESDRKKIADIFEGRVMSMANHALSRVEGRTKRG